MRFLLFLHGSEVLSLVGGLRLGFFGALSVVLWIFYSPPKKPYLPLILYGFLAVLVGIWYQIGDGTLGFLLAIAVGFPWSLVAVFAATFLNEENLSLPLGFILNGALIYALGLYSRRSLDRQKVSHIDETIHG